MAGALHIPRRLSPERVDALFAAEQGQDPIGVNIQLFFALGACFFAGWSTSYVEWCALPVLICFLVRMTGRHMILEPLAHDRVLWLLLAWGAWMGVSVLWCAGTRTEWVQEVKSLRFLAMAVVLWPSMDRRSWLVAALMAGIACGQLSQIVHLVTIQMGTAWMPFHRADGRVTGAWDPVSAGTVLCAGLGLWLAPALFGATGRARAIGAIGTCVTLACIALTGTRGAWIGAAMLCVIAVVIAAWRVRPSSRVLVPVGVIGALMIGGAGGGYLAAGPKIADRLQRGVDEVRAAMSNRDYSTDTGLRIAMWKWAWAAARDHPIVGVGAGGYRPWVWTQTAASAERLGAPEEAIGKVRTQAHSWYLHTLATLGVVGLGLVGSLTLFAMRAGLRNTSGAPGGLAGALWAGPALGLIGLACAGLFDTITVNQQPTYLFYLLVAMCLPSRPREAP